MKRTMRNNEELFSQTDPFFSPPLKPYIGKLRLTPCTSYLTSRSKVASKSLRVVHTEFIRAPLKTYFGKKVSTELSV